MTGEELRARLSNEMYSYVVGEHDYVAFAVSRWLAGTFASAPSALGGGIILDIFFLHQRGKAFAFYQDFVIFGASFGATLCGFIIHTAPWPTVFRWTIGAHGLTAVLVFLFLEDTTYPRDGSTRTKETPHSWLSNRCATSFPGHRVVYRNADAYHGPFDSIIIGLQPVTIMSGLFLLIAFGWAVATTTLLPVFLEAPVNPAGPGEVAGYGFTPLRVSYFSFAAWAAFVLAALYGTAFNDRLPLWMCRRNAGIWRPEHRLWPVLIPPLLLIPSMLGLYGAALQYQLHYIVRQSLVRTSNIANAS